VTAASNPARRGRLAAATIGVLGLGVAVAGVARASVRWGATDADVARPMVGDDLLPQADLVTTHAVGIPADPTDVWPWIVQMGLGRAGWYSYDLVDNLGRPSATRVHPEWQDLAEGDRIPVLPTDPHARRAGFEVVHLDPPHELVWRAGGTSWTFVWDWEVVPVDAGCRLVVRTRVGVDVTGVGRAVALAAAPGHWVMQRRQLLGIRRRALG
jgi:hypothetical protein